MFGHPASFLSTVGDVLTNWITLVVIMAALGVAAGLLIFVYVYPGQPRIGIIDLPYTVISDDSAYVIGEYLNYAREDDSVKAVVIKITSPGGEASSSERLYLETARLAEEKPVVVVMNWLVASGGYFMAMGANHTFAQTSSLVGSVGVVASSQPLVPPLSGEALLTTGPYKSPGFSREQWLESLEDLKDTFAQVVIAERGDKLRLSREELTEGRLYTGVEAVRLGLTDELGGDRDAIEKAAELAGISGYGFVDVNYEVLKQYVKELDALFPIGAGQGDWANTEALIDPNQNVDGLAPGGSLPAADTGQEQMEALRGLMLYGRLGVREDDPLPDFPVELNHPNFYYLYVGNAP